MVLFQRIDPLPHIEIQREADQGALRPRPARAAPIRRPDNRQEHGARLKEQTTVASEDIARVRRSLGIDPRRLLVLRFETLDVDQRETLQQLGITAVEELRETRDNRLLYRVLGQFPDDQTLQAFLAEYDRYAEDTPRTTALPHARRRDFLDALESVSSVMPQERQGRRLLREGVPSSERFYLDVDLWNPGTPEGQAEVRASFRQFVETFGGRIARDPLQIPSLILVKVEATTELLQGLLELDLVALVDLPPIPFQDGAFDIFQTVAVPNPLPSVPINGPLACVVDSGVVAGHPLLRGTVIEEEDFDSGEGTTVDRNGHGTQVSGLVVYGDIARRSVTGEWYPQVAICTAKVLRHRDDPTGVTDGSAEFPEEERAEEQIKRAIEYYHVERGVRVFNLSLGHADRIYGGGRQLPWAEVLDELARRLDIVIIVSAGNVADPGIPVGIHSNQVRQALLRQLSTPDHRLIDPATAALALTVGSIARRADPFDNQRSTRLAASLPDCPSPFTRCGPGVAGAVKPELVHYGGNFAIDGLGSDPHWQTQDPHLGEPTLNHAFATGRLLKATAGTSYAAAHVTHIAARVEAALREQMGVPPSANVIRALVVNSARVNSEVVDWLGEQEKTILRTVGYGQPRVEACWSTSNRVTLFAEDLVGYKSFHVYALKLPDVFLETKGWRSVIVTLAYDPPTRLSRRYYIANSMWIEVYRGLTTEQIIEYRSKYEGDGDPPKVPERNKLDFRPAARTLRNSTVQNRSWHSNRGSKLDYRPDNWPDATFHIFVGCQPRFPNPTGEEHQRYALVVALEHKDQAINLYQEIRARVRTRVRVRTS